MRPRLPSVVLALALVSPACAPHGGPAVPPPAPVPVQRTDVRPPQAFASTLAPLESAIRERLSGEGGVYAIAVIDIETGRSLGVNDRLELHAASTMKVPVLLELYRQAAAGRLDLDAEISVRSRFRSIADASHFYELQPSDDSERALYSLVGRTTTLRDLARRMIVRSSNLATNILIDTLSAVQVQSTTERAGGVGVRVLRGVEDGPAFRAGLNNTVTARGLASLLAAIARCDVLPRAECAEVIDVLAAQEFRDMIPAGLPDGTRVAHKKGWITGIRHDAAIVLPASSPPFVLVVLSRGAPDTLSAYRVAADIARLSWDALGPRGSLRPRWAPLTLELLRVHEDVRVPAFPSPRLPHEELWRELLPVIEHAPALHADEIGRSAGGLPLRMIRFGGGPARVLLWSQMHGDETTASRALADLFHYIAQRPADPRVRRWAERLEIAAIPMLNPDGADAHRRRGVHGIDINRDARMLATPEGRALKAAQEQIRPDYGFNLHDQNPRSRVGGSGRVAAMSLLAPPPDADATPTPGFTRALQLTAHIAGVLAPLVGEHLTRYDDSYNARAFGDGMQSWGVSTVLIETGSWGRDDAKQYLRGANFVALVAALDAIADGSYVQTDVALYRTLPPNSRAMHDLIVRGGVVVLPGIGPYRADIAIDAAAVGGPTTTQIVDVGDLTGSDARDVIDASGLFVHPEHSTGMQPGQMPLLTLRRTADAASEVVWSIEGVTARQLALPF
jgi:beta-lactamase class A